MPHPIATRWLPPPVAVTSSDYGSPRGWPQRTSGRLSTPIAPVPRSVHSPSSSALARATSVKRILRDNNARRKDQRQRVP
jgi:hypothetical protein